MISLENDKFLSALKSNDHKAFEHIFLVYFPRLQNFAMQYMEDQESADDLVQECFAYLWENRSSLQIRDLKAFLYTMTRNKCLNELKRRAIVRGYQKQYVEKSKDLELLTTSDFTERPDTQLMADELEKQIDELFNLLPERTREAFRLSRIEGKKNKEIAEHMGVSVKMIEKHITTALRLFREHLRHK